MKKTNLIAASLSALALSACGEGENLAGKWLQPVPNMPQMKNGRQPDPILHLFKIVFMF